MNPGFREKPLNPGYSLGNTFHGIYVGTIVFSNKYFSADVAEWGIDSVAEQTAISELTKLGRYRVGVVDRGAEAVKVFYKKGNSQEIDYPRLLKLVKSNGYDTVFNCAANLLLKHADAPSGIRND